MCRSAWISTHCGRRRLAPAFEHSEPAFVGVPVLAYLRCVQMSISRFVKCLKVPARRLQPKPTSRNRINPLSAGVRLGIVSCRMNQYIPICQRAVSSWRRQYPMVPRAHVGVNGSFGTIITVFRPFAQKHIPTDVSKVGICRRFGFAFCG